MAARLQLCSLAILPSHTPCQLLRAYQHKTVLDLIFQIHTVVMRISRCRPWLTCWRCAHSLRHRIARRSARLLNRFKRLLYLRGLQYLRRLLYLQRLKYLQRLSSETAMSSQTGDTGPAGYKLPNRRAQKQG